MKRLMKVMACLCLISMQTFFVPGFARVVNIPPFKVGGLVFTTSLPKACIYMKKVNVLSGGYISSVGLVNTPVDGRLAHKYLNMEKGNALLNPDKDICINTHVANVQIKVGATIFLMESERGTVIYDLSQTNSKQVTVIVDKDMMIMHPGQVLVLTKQNTQKFEELEAECHSVNYRRPLEIALPNSEIKAFVAQFSILSAFRKIEPLQRLSLSDDKRDKIVVERLLRIAVAIGEGN